MATAHHQIVFHCGRQGKPKAMVPKKLLLLTIWALCACCCYGDTPSAYFLEQLPWETRDHLLQLQPHLSIMRLTGSPIPLYRPDMGDQIAYWLINYDHHHYAIVSAGQHTGDSMLLMQGEGPSPVSSLQEQARSLHNSTCLRYLVLTPSPDLNLACDTAQGRLTLTPLAADVNVSSLWEEMKMKSQHDEDDMGDLDDNNTTIHLHVISAMEPASFPMTGMRDCHIRSLGQSDGSELSVKVLCKLLGVCDERGRVHTHLQTDYGEVYVHLKPVHEDQHPRFEHDLHFEVVGHHVSDGLVIKRFAVEPFHRVKRQASSYTEFTINDSHLMPNYNQFKRGKCQVGCGPVAWAQVFGYYDRRAHLGSGSSASKALYRCGTDGTSGDNSCVAPSYNDNRMKNYIGKLNDIMRTFCLFGSGATLQKRMDDVEGFFKQRQGSSADVILEARKFFLTRLVGTYSDKIRDKALSYLRQKWPVIVGFRVSGVFSQHYAVMTKYRTRTIRKKKCFLFFCRTRSVREYDMFLHMGWGGSKNGWRKAEMFMAVVAKY
ncbi:uncharacterized protein LOC143292912 [Babylonia areolata]|uniref:uncharacterized protein LOC143292912 n=1 Tax=Babylonia areolata TaxID=304850 RepID=UPI003FD1B5BD